MNAASYRQVLLQQRLNALQLKVWYPRKPMAGSRIVLTSLQGSIANVESQQATTVLEVAPTAQPAATKLITNPAITAQASAALLPAQASVQVVRQSARGVEFVQHWWFHQGLLMIDTRPVDAATGDLAESDQLLCALLRICAQVHRPDTVWSIDWPLFEHRGIKHDWSEAQFYVQQRWQSFVAEHQVERVLLFGEDTRGLLGFADTELPSAQRWIETETSMYLLRSVSAKRALWQNLQQWLGEQRPL